MGNDCCAPDPQRHLSLKHSHLWYDCCGLDDTGGMDHMGQNQIHINRTTALCIDLSRIWISSSKKKRNFSICMQSPHLPNCAASLGSICKHFSTFIAMLLPVQSFTETHSDSPFLQGSLLIFFQLPWPSGNWNRRAPTPCQRFCFTVLWCSLWLNDEYQFNYTWERWLSFLLLSHKSGNEFQLLLRNCYSTTMKSRISTCTWLVLQPF